MSFPENDMPEVQTMEFAPAIAEAELEKERQSRRKWWLVVALISTITFSFGSMLNPSRIETRTIVHTAPTVVTVPPTAQPAPTVTVTRDVMPASCKAALTYLQQLATTTQAIINVGGKAQALLQDAYVAIADKDLAAINKTADDIHKLDNSISDPALNYQNVMHNASESTDSCLKQIK
jgi:citrate lyase beta subunit